MRHAWSLVWQLPNLASLAHACVGLSRAGRWALVLQSSPHPMQGSSSPRSLSCTQIHHGRDTHQGKEDTDPWESLPHLPGLKLRALEGWLLQHRTEAVGGCPSLPASSTIRHKPSHISVLSAPGTCAPSTAPSDRQSQAKKLL